MRTCLAAATACPPTIRITPILFFEPKKRTTYLFNVFAQDEVAFGRGVFGTLGSKLEHNSYSGWELQPTGRIRWTRGRDTLWGAVSRAVRMPTRVDSDVRVTAGMPAVVLTGNDGFLSEKMVAYEAGFRSQPIQRISYEAAVYYDRYDDLRSQDLIPNAPLTFANSVEGHISGFELGATWEPLTSARLHGSYTYLHRSIVRKPGSTDITGGEGNDAPHVATLQLFTDLRPGVQLNVVTRYIAALPRPQVPKYAEADVTLQWDVRPSAELALVGQNLLHDRHPEFSTLEEYDRSVFVTLMLRR